MSNNKRILLIIITLAVAAGAVFLYRFITSPRIPDDGSLPQSTPASGSSTAARGGRIVPVRIFIAEYERLDEGIDVIGTLLPNEQVELASETSGKVDQIFFQEGSRVKKGMVLVKINDEDLQAQLKRARFQAATLADRLERNRILLEKDAISRESFDQVETEYNMLMADIQLLEVRLDKTGIKAPFDGVIGFRYIALGSYLQPNTLIATLVDESNLKVEFSIPERYRDAVTVGSNIYFTVQGDNRRHSATVYVKDSQIDTRTRTLTVRALFDNTSAKMLPGMMAGVTVGRRSGSTIQVPTEAIVPAQNMKTVWVVRDGKARSVEVETGQRNESMISITRGIAQGDSVVISGLMQLREGTAVAVSM